MDPAESHLGLHCLLTEISIIRPVAGQGSSPETRFSFLKHFRILYLDSYQTRFKSIKGFATTDIVKI